MKVLLAAFLSFSLPAAASGERAVSVASSPLKACPGGLMIVASFPLGGDSPFSAAVFHDGSKTLTAALADLRGRGLDPVGLVNGGYFDPKGGGVVSYYKSTVFANQALHNSARGPRACMVFDPESKRLSVLQSDQANYDRWRSGGGEIYCSGPQLVEGGADVSARQSCAEHFLPECRADRSDPGVNLKVHYPRTGSCVTADGTLKLFSANSDEEKCGATAELMARSMIAEGCADGINHDGGGSAKLFVAPEQGAPVTAAGAGEDRGRAIPVWLVVLRRKRR
jgi:hypothetical protein